MIFFFSSFQTQRNRDRYSYNNEIKIHENKTSILLNCTENNLYVENEMLKKSVLACQKLKWTIYEVYKIYQWCNQGTEATFFLATETNSAQLLLGAICFDLKNWSLKSISYQATAPTDDVEVVST